MEELIICSPKGISNKEKYLNDELTRVKGRKIFSIEIKEKGNIQIQLEKNSASKKYFVRIVKKAQEDDKDVTDFLKKNAEAIKASNLIKSLEYDNFFVLFFEKIKIKQ